MQNRLIGFSLAAMVASAMATNGCSATTDAAGSGGGSNTAQTGGLGGGSNTAQTGGSGGGSNIAQTGGSGGSSSSTNIGGTGTGGSSEPGSVTTLSATKALSALTSAEATQLCANAYAYFDRAISRSVLCKAKGLAFGVSSSAPTDAMLQDNCKGQETTCLQASPASPNCDPLPSPCNATVAAYSACIADQASTYNQGVSGLTGCATVTHDDLPAVWDFVTQDAPSSCTTMVSICAGLNYPTPR